MRFVGRASPIITMKTASVRDLRNSFSRLSKWLAAGETIQIVKRGKPIARIVPEPDAGTFFGAGAGTVKLPSDVDEPVTAAWDAQG
jgi:antitoxin (DNA-binding transcriptional repressor) of toxin-antitoxin stability system